MELDLASQPNVDKGHVLGLATNQMVASLARSLAPLSIEVSIPRAIETIRNCSLDVYPVVSGPRLVMLLSESELAEALLALPPDLQDQYRHLPLSAIVNPLLPQLAPQRVLFNSSPISEAVSVFREEPGVSVIAVLDQAGFYSGILSRSDLVAACFKTLAPPRVGGMATPLGVYLTDGIDQGGVGNFALMLAGASLSVLFASAFAFSQLLNEEALAHHIDLWGRLGILLVPIMPRYAFTFSDTLENFFPLILMMLFLRLIPVAGYHAAEHQVVHCIERGEPLVYDKVTKMPRPHPRCGTNLVAAVTLFGIYFSVCIGLLGPSTAVIPAGIMTLLTWRQVGTFLQQYFTTRKASRKQIASGIAAGEDLLAKFRQNTNRTVKLPLRIWRMGFLQMFAGVGIVAGLFWILSKIFPQLHPYLQGIS
jgi:hypothetical protein